MSRARGPPIPLGAEINGYVIGAPLMPPTRNSWVFDATSHTTPGKFVFKYIHPRVPRHLMDGEVDMNCRIAGCPHVVVGFDFVDIDDTCGYFMHKYECGDLWDLLERSVLDEPYACQISVQILRALDCLHCLGIAHRDVKLENILLDKDGNAFLCDFGLAAARSEGELFTEIVGTKQYYAPELLCTQNYTEKVDIWAFGVVLFLLLTRRYPFPELAVDPLQFEHQVCEGHWDQDFLGQLNVSDDLSNIVNLCLTTDPSQRPTAGELLRFPVFQRDRLLQSIKADVDDIGSACRAGDEFGRKTGKDASV
jgi:serine/threonine protein kinase